MHFTVTNKKTFVLVPGIRGSSGLQKSYRSCIAVLFVAVASIEVWCLNQMYFMEFSAILRLPFSALNDTLLIMNFFVVLLIFYALTSCFFLSLHPHITPTWDMSI